MKRVGIYIRVSTEEQARIQDGSLVSQRQRLIEYVDGQNRRDPNWGVIVDFYCDDKSAKDMNRPEFQRMLHDIRVGRVNLILSTELSRLSRSLKDFCEVWDLLKKHSTGVITLREQFDTTTAAGEMMVFNLMNFAQYERKQTAERISANWASRAKRGLFNGGQVPLGFDRNSKSPGELLPHPTEARTVCEIFETFLKVGSIRETCRELTRLGIYSKQYTNKHGIEKGGGHMTVPSLFRILTSKSYIGLREFNKSKTEIEVVKAAWPAIVDIDVFNQVQERLGKNKNKFKPDEWKKYPYPMTELLVCGECGKKLGGKSAHGRNKKHHYYGHPRQLNSDGVTHLQRCRLERVRAERIEDIILASLKKLIQTPGLVEHWLEVYAKSTHSEVPALEAKIKTMDLEIESKNRRAQNLVSRIAELPADVPAEIFYQQIKETNQKIQELKQAKQELLSKSIVLKDQAIDKDGLIEKIKNTVANLEATPAEKRKPLYSNLIQFAELHPTKIKLGVIAPAQGQYTATGTDGASGAESGFHNFEGEPGKVVNFVKRGGSTSVTFGAQRGSRTPMPRGARF